MVRLSGIRKYVPQGIARKQIRIVTRSARKSLNVLVK